MIITILDFFIPFKEYPCTCGDQPTTQSIPPPTSYSTTRSPSTPQPSTVDGMDPTTITMQPTQLINASNATTIGMQIIGCS